MDDVTRDRFTFSDFRLRSGEVLPEVTIAYSTRGRLAPDGRNAVLVTHGYTSGHQMIEPTGTSSEGSWTTLVGPGAPIDTERNYVVASNMLGSSFGSTNAASVDLRTGKRYGSRFPKIALQDIVAAQHQLLRVSRRDAFACGGGAILWRLPGVPMGRQLSRLHGWHRARGVRAQGAVEYDRRHAYPLRARSQLERWRLLRHPGRHARHDDRVAHGHAAPLWHERRGDDPPRRRAMGRRVRRQLAADTRPCGRSL